MRMSRWLAGLCLLLSTAAWADDDGALRFCLLAANQPFSLESNESGLEVEIARQLAATLETKAELVWLASASEFEQALVEKHCDLVPGALAEAGTLAGPPLAGVRLTRPYYAAGYHLIRRPDTPSVSELEALGQMRLGIEGDSIVNFTLRQRGQPVQVMFNTDAVVNTIASGELDYGLVWGPVAAWELRHRSDVVLDSMYSVEPRWRFAIAVHNEQTALWRKVDSALQHLLENGDIAQLFADRGVPYLHPDSAGTQ
ncbi:transporter substrate-binding domain-containing protein [Proteobacteria bacterium 005FR1]|nr:transporter substrate-binding domain-containing protein [Proteobacteria bacterium 005FR1]